MLDKKIDEVRGHLEIRKHLVLSDLNIYGGFPIFMVDKCLNHYVCFIGQKNYLFACFHKHRTSKIRKSKNF